MEAAAKSHDVSSEQTGEGSVKEEKSEPEATRFELREEMYIELIADVDNARTNLMRLRSHTARKQVVEAQQSRKRMNSLQPDEAIVVMDFKQKILQSYYRENQQKYFAKRGISCLGVMIITRPQCDDESEMSDDYLDATFMLLLSNDTTQDATYINAAKNYIYNEVLPTKFSGLDTPIKVRYVSDRAGAFNSNVSKACMPFWYSWTDGKVEEIEGRVSVSGDGETALDGLFGVFGDKLQQSIDNQNGDIADAESVLSRFELSGGIKGTTALLFSPSREAPFDTNDNRLKDYHHLVLNREKKAITCRFTTDIGKGMNILLESIAKRWNHELAATAKSEQSAACHTESFQSRQEKKITSRVEKKNAKFMEEREEESNRLSAKEDMGDRIFMCNERNSSDTDYCMCEFRSKEALQKHLASGDHRFPAQDLADSWSGKAVP